TIIREMNRPNYELVRPRAAIAGILGAVVGAGIVVSERLALVAWYNPDLQQGYHLPWWWGPGVGLFIWFYTSIVFAIGIGTLGIAVWWLLDRFHRTGWLDAFIAGTMLTFASYYCIV